MSISARHALEIDIVDTNLERCYYITIIQTKCLNKDSNTT